MVESPMEKTGLSPIYWTPLPVIIVGEDRNVEHGWAVIGGT
jgi:hypothetical protein